ncbi:MAG: VWA domain-containing protein, partial [Planctomycetota bacterium]
PLVLFLTDGLPTVGETSEAGIRDAALKANRFERRVFTFGVGVDVNTPLLEKIASETRAASTFVLPKEDVEVKVAGVFKRLSGPVLAEPKLELVDKEGRPALGRTRDLIPSKLPDLFEGDQLVLLGQYLGDEPVTFRLGGNYLGKKRTFRFTFGFDKATTRNAFVPRLWASRKIAVLIDAIRQLGADGDVARNPAAIRNDPKLKELVDEIVRLSTEFGILTEYTAFLAREGSDLSREEALRTAVGNFNSRAVSVRHGIASVNQDVNRQFQVQTEQLNRFNNYWDKNMQQVRITTVQQVADRAFYLRDGTWVDGRLLNPKGGKLEADRKVRIGSEEYRKLVEELIKEGRNGSASFRGKTLLKHKNKSILCW